MRYVYITSAASKGRDSSRPKHQDWKKGDRIVVEVNDEYFLATVTTIRNKKIYLRFDDGDTGNVSVGSSRILGRGIKRQVKKSFDRQSASKYIAVAKDKKKPSREAANRKIDIDIKTDAIPLAKPQLLVACRFFDEKDNEWKCGRIIKLTSKNATVLSWEHNTIWTYQPDLTSLYKRSKDGDCPLSKDIAKAYAKYLKAIETDATGFERDVIVEKAKYILAQDLRKEHIVWPEYKPRPVEIGSCVRFLYSTKGGVETHYYGRVVHIASSRDNPMVKVLYRDKNTFKRESALFTHYFVLDGAKESQIKAAIPDKLVDAWSQYYAAFSKDSASKKADKLKEKAEALERKLTD